jgi:hypothetical protein
LCQLGIQYMKNNGDAYVMLANAFQLAALRCVPAKVSAFYFQSRACAVIYRWSHGGFDTQNKEIGAKVLHDITEQLMMMKGSSLAQAKDEMQKLHDRLASDAINPDSWNDIKQMMQG